MSDTALPFSQGQAHTGLVETPFAFLDAGLNVHASDWQLCENQPVAYRVAGSMRRETDALSTEVFDAFIKESVGTFSNHHDDSFAYHGNRFRLSLFLSREGRCATIRHLPKEIRSTQDLGLPSQLLELIRNQSGLVIVTGPTGSGKSATLASLVDYLNHQTEDEGVIITLEDPVEYVHQSHKCIVRQREFGRDFTDFAAGLKAALRQDPDVIMLGEMRDPVTIGTALTAAETGHLVFGTLHTGSAAGTISRILDGAPKSEAEQQRVMLAQTLRAVVAQKLIPTIDGKRCAALEVLIATDPIRNCIRQGTFHLIYDEITRGIRHGMVTMDASLEALVRRRRISVTEALKSATNPVTLQGKLGNFA
jgi:twitching motility protein PilT